VAGAGKQHESTFGPAAREQQGVPRACEFGWRAWRLQSQQGQGGRPGGTARTSLVVLLVLLLIRKLLPRLTARATGAGRVLALLVGCSGNSKASWWLSAGGGGGSGGVGRRRTFSCPWGRALRPRVRQTRCQRSPSHPEASSWPRQAQASSAAAGPWRAAGLALPGGAHELEQS
jgi:hypothetical protein